MKVLSLDIFAARAPYVVDTAVDDTKVSRRKSVFVVRLVAIERPHQNAHSSHTAVNPQFRIGGKTLGIRVVCPQKGTAVPNAVLPDFGFLCLGFGAFFFIFSSH